MISTVLDFTQIRFRGPAPALPRRSRLGRAGARRRRRAARISLRTRIGNRLWRGCARPLDPGRIAEVVSIWWPMLHPRRTRDAGAHRQFQPMMAPLPRDDNRGPTIAASLLAHLFEPFWQAPNEGERRRSTGLGLGLYIVQTDRPRARRTIDVRSADEVTAHGSLPRQLAAN